MQNHLPNKFLFHSIFYVILKKKTSGMKHHLSYEPLVPRATQFAILRSDMSWWWTSEFVRSRLLAKNEARLCQSWGSRLLGITFVALSYSWTTGSSQSRSSTIILWRMIHAYMTCRMSWRSHNRQGLSRICHRAWRIPKACSISFRAASWSIAKSWPASSCGLWIVLIKTGHGG